MSDEMAKERKVLDKLVDKFEGKVEEDDSLEDKLKDFKRDVRVDFRSGNSYHFTLDETEISEIKMEDDVGERDADIIVSSDVETLEGLLDGDVGVMQAYAKNKIKVDAPLTDMLKFKQLL
ncbi:MAG: SCP2 sterol-binding domain-containing protein [Candidatus Aenigmatarchaeota archaeon]